MWLTFDLRGVLPSQLRRVQSVYPSSQEALQLCMPAAMAPHPPPSGAPMAAPAVPSRFFRESVGPAPGAAGTEGTAGQNGNRSRRPSPDLAVVPPDEHTSHGPSLDVDSAHQRSSGEPLTGRHGVR
jgi:hypothetical protein